MFGFNFAPLGWAFCNGQILSIQQNSALFALLGTIYGGNGVTTFALPNLQSRVPLHWGQGLGLSQFTIGQIGGVENVTLLTSNMPSHTHGLGTLALRVKNGQANSQSPVGNVPAIEAAGVTATYSTLAPDASLNALAISGLPANAGGNSPFDIHPPYLAVTFCIALQGIFPARN